MLTELRAKHSVPNEGLYMGIDGNQAKEKRPVKAHSMKTNVKTTDKIVQIQKRLQPQFQGI